MGATSVVWWSHGTHQQTITVHQHQISSLALWITSVTCWAHLNWNAEFRQFDTGDVALREEKQVLWLMTTLCKQVGNIPVCPSARSYSHMQWRVPVSRCSYFLSAKIIIVINRPFCRVCKGQCYFLSGCNVSWDVYFLWYDIIIHISEIIDSELHVFPIMCIFDSNKDKIVCLIQKM